MLFDSFMPRHATVFGLFRRVKNTPLNEDSEFQIISNTPQCEDMHFHEASGLIFTAGEANAESRFSWWPIVNNFDGLGAAQTLQGALKVIDPQTRVARDLRLEGFDKPFLTHGMDIIDDPSMPAGSAIFIMVINHRPRTPKEANTSISGSTSTSYKPKSDSVVEVFHHKVHTDAATHVRTVWHSLITTPNDLMALSPSSFLVTNDHYFREGYLKFVEDVNWLSRWANVAHVRFEPSSREGITATDASGVHASIALSNIHSANGIGRGRDQSEVVITSAASGVAHLGKIITDDLGNVRLQLKESIKFQSMLDNPSYFRDPFAVHGDDKSSFVFAGLAKAVKIFWTMKDPQGADPSIVWRLPASRLDGSDTPLLGNRTGVSVEKLFEDDGKRIRSSSTALLVAIKPSKSTGKRQAWLYVTGFFSANMVVFKVDL